MRRMTGSRNLSMAPGARCYLVFVSVELPVEDDLVVLLVELVLHPFRVTTRKATTTSKAISFFTTTSFLDSTRINATYLRNDHRRTPYLFRRSE